MMTSKGGHHNMIAKRAHLMLTAILASLTTVLLQGCAGVTTFPTAARPGDTVALMVGGSEQARKANVSVTLTDSAGGVWDLQALGKVRSLFNVRPDGSAAGLYYSDFGDQQISWAAGAHEPVQTVLVIDLPSGVATGAATLKVSLNAPDNGSGIADPTSLNIDIVPGTGASDPIARQDPAQGSIPANFSRLEPAPYAKVSFNNWDTKIGAASFVINFDSSVLNGNDIDVYVPQATVRQPGASFGTNTQRMVSWHQDGTHVYVDVVSPQGITPSYLQFYVITPSGTTAPNFTLASSHLYDINGNPISGLTPTLQYFP